MSQKLIDLKNEEYEHPFDKKALAAFKAVPGAETVTNFFLNWTAVKWNAMQLAGSNFNVNRNSCKELYEQIEEVANTLSVLRMPKIYTDWGYFVNAYTTGYDEDILLVLYSGAVDLMERKELDFIIGHEMGHIRSGHVLWHTMGSMLSMIPARGLVTESITIALYYWMRMSEFTADRAGLLACQDLDAVLNAILKMAGLPQKYFNTNCKEAFLKQAEEFSTVLDEGFLNKGIRTLSIINQSHPWTVLRAAELIKWVDSGNYQKILDNHSGWACKSGHAVSKNFDKCPVCGKGPKD